MADLIFLGVQHCRGTSSKTGKDYDFCQLLYGDPIREVAKPDRRVDAYGVEAKAIDLEPSALHEFKDCKVGQVVSVVVEPALNSLNRNRVTGLA